MVLAEGESSRCRGGALYGRGEIRNNRRGKQLAAKQAINTSEARDVLLKDMRSKDVDGGGRREEGEGGGAEGGRRLGFMGHLLACGLHIYRSIGQCNSYGSHESCQINTDKHNDKYTHRFVRIAKIPQAQKCENVHL